MTIAYPIVLTPDDNDTLLVTCPQLPAVATFGADEADARHHALDAIAVVLGAMIDDDDNIPKPDGVGDTVVALPLLASLKLELYWAMKETGTGRTDLARRLGVSSEAVGQLLNLDRQSHLDDLESAFAALGYRIDMNVRRAA